LFFRSRSCSRGRHTTSANGLWRRYYRFSLFGSRDLGAAGGSFGSASSLTGCSLARSGGRFLLWFFFYSSTPATASSFFTHRFLLILHH